MHPIFLFSNKLLWIGIEFIEVGNAWKRVHNDEDFIANMLCQIISSSKQKACILAENSVK